MLSKIFEDSNRKSIEKRCRLYILFSGGLSAAFSVVILIVAARTISIEDTGILTIAIAVAKLLLNIGKYGMRNYQVTDTNKVGFSEWLYSRCITVFVMMLCSVIYVVYQKAFNGYYNYKAVMVILVCLIYALESFEDIYTGHCQREGRLDAASYIQSIRYVWLYLIFGLGLILTKNLLFTTIASVIVSAVIVCYYGFRIIRQYNIKLVKPQRTLVKKILVDCFPLCVMNFMLIYLSYAPKYEIDRMYESDVQAYYGFISMPIFTISLFSGFIFQPQLVNLSTSWTEKMYSRFWKIVRRQLVYIFGVSAACVLTGWAVGIPILTVLYGVDDLEKYKTIFVVLLIGGAGTAVVNFITALLVIFRKQRSILYAYLASSAAVFISIKFAIKRYGIIGASVDTTVLIWILTVVLAVLFFRTAGKKCG